MTDRELWVKSCKTVGAMVGGTVLFLGASSLILLAGAGGHATSASESRAGTGAPPMTNITEGKGPEGMPGQPRNPRRVGIKGEQRPAEAHPGESI
jgi:hypothetical protein